MLTKSQRRLVAVAGVIVGLMALFYILKIVPSYFRPLFMHHSDKGFITWSREPVIKDTYGSVLFVDREHNIVVVVENGKDSCSHPNRTSLFSGEYVICWNSNYEF